MLIVNKMYKPEIGGVEVIAEQIAGMISEKYGRCDVLTFNSSGKKSMETLGKVNVIRLGSVSFKKSIRWSMRYISEFKKLCKNNSTVIYNYPSFQPEVYKRKYFGINKIVYYHADVTRAGSLGRAYQKFIGKRFLSNADLILVSNPNIIESSIVLSEFKGKCKVLPYGIDTDKYKFRENNKKEEILSRFDSQDCKLMLFVGRMARYKGVENILKAMCNLEDKYKLVIVSNDEMNEELKEYIRKNNLKKRIVQYKGIGDDMISYYYSACDVLLMPSIDRAEAFGLVAVEAMACSLPVITTQLYTGTSYHNIDGVTGHIIEPNNIEQIVESVQDICNAYSGYNKEIIRKRALDFSEEKFRVKFLEIIGKYARNKERLSK